MATSQFFTVANAMQKYQIEFQSPNCFHVHMKCSIGRKGYWDLIRGVGEG